jgi:hypothetical protein
VLVWHRYLERKEALLAAESDPVKIARAAEVGVDLLVPGADPDDFAALLEYTRRAVDSADTYFAVPNTIKFNRTSSQLSFPTPVDGLSPGPNETAHAIFFEAKNCDKAVVLLPHWNSDLVGYRTFGRALAYYGISCLQLVLPYHGQRQTPGVGFAMELVSENLSLTIQSNRQAIIEARACLAWLKAEGYRQLGVIGVSIGSSIASIVAALEPEVKAVALLLMADDFAEVVWTGSATTHVKNSLCRRFTLEQVCSCWSVISPRTYAARLKRNILIVSGILDTVFIPELTRKYVTRLTDLRLQPRWVRLGCGHYTLAVPPYSWIAFLRTLLHLRKNMG